MSLTFRAFGPLSRFWAWGAMLGTLASAAHAQNADVGAVADSLASQGGSVADLLGVVSFLAGVGLAIAGLLKFRQNAMNPNDPSAKISTAFTLVLVGAAMVAIPTTLGVGIGTIFGSGAETASADGSAFRSIN